MMIACNVLFVLTKTKTIHKKWFNITLSSLIGTTYNLLECFFLAALCHSLFLCFIMSTDCDQFKQRVFLLS